MHRAVNKSNSCQFLLIYVSVLNIDDVGVERLEGGRVFANLEMHETDVSSNPSDESASGLPPVGSIVTAQ